MPNGKLVVSQMEISQSQILEVVDSWHLLAFAINPSLYSTGLLCSKLITLWAWVIILVPI